jgi:hypothetical protein
MKFFPKNLKRRILFSLNNSVHKYLYALTKKETAKNRIHKTDITRESWEKCFLSLWESAYFHLSEGKTYLKIDGPQISNSGKRSDWHEGFARTFIGAAFYLHHKNEGEVTLTTGEKIDIPSIYRTGIVNGANPDHSDYWGKIKSNQVLVENASIACGLLLTPQHILSKLSRKEKEQLSNWFKISVKKEFRKNNWQWFKVFHYLLLEELEIKSYENEIQEILKVIEHLYQGKGWYTDGIRKNEYQH